MLTLGTVTFNPTTDLQINIDDSRVKKLEARIEELEKENEALKYYFILHKEVKVGKIKKMPYYKVQELIQELTTRLCENKP